MQMSGVQLAITYGIIFIVYGLTLKLIALGLYLDALKLAIVLAFGAYFAYDIIGEPMKIFFSKGNTGHSFISLITIYFMLSIFLNFTKTILNNSQTNRKNMKNTK